MKNLIKFFLFSKVEEVREEMNSWVENHTNNLIKDLLPAGSVASDTDKIYANALYFKGAWKRPFEKYNTRDRDFHLVNGTSVSVPFMTSSDDQYVRAYDGFKVLRLPYRRGSNDSTSPIRKFSMYFFLPDKKDGLYELLEKMGSTPGFVDNHIPRFRDELEAFRIPKFRISFGFSVSTVLDQLGMRSISYFHCTIKLAWRSMRKVLKLRLQLLMKMRVVLFIWSLLRGLLLWLTIHFFS